MVLAILLFGSMFLPFDVTIRNADRFAIKPVPVIVVGGALQRVRDAKASGLKENVDFVVYDHGCCGGGVVNPKWALLISLPVNFKIRTPIFQA